MHDGDEYDSVNYFKPSHEKELKILIFSELKKIRDLKSETSNSENKYNREYIDTAWLWEISLASFKNVCLLVS